MKIFKYGEFEIDQRTIFIAALSILLVGASLSAETTGKYVSVPVNVSLVHKVSIGDAVAGGTGKKVINNGFALSLLSGKAAKLRGVDLSGIWSEYTEDIRGVQFSGIFTTVRGDMEAGQLAGILNIVGGQVSGVQGAGIFNVVGDQVSGIQGAGIFNAVGGQVSGVQGAIILNAVGDNVSGIQGTNILNLVGDQVTGIQGAGILNIVGDQVTGVQGAGILNIVGDQVTGIQGAGIWNITGKSFSGFQGAGILNITGESFSGLQAAGIINVASKVKNGAQIGLINVSQENYGVPIGPVSYVKTIGFGYDLWGDETRFVQLGLRSGTECFYNVLSLGVRPGDIWRWSVGWGFGGHLGISDKISLDIGGFTSHINEEEAWTKQTNLLNKLQITAVFESSKGIITFIGPTFNIWVSKRNDGSEIAPWSVYDKKSGSTWIRMWPGIIAGIRF